jgi:hypothetical protein
MLTKATLMLLHINMLLLMSQIKFSAAFTTVPTPPSTLVRLSAREYPLAVCLDGTPGGYYYRPALERDGERKWYD